jgi:hypothetical protein
MSKLVNGNRNIAIGADSLYFPLTAQDVIAIGTGTFGVVGEDFKYCIAIGTQAMSNAQSGVSCVIAIGNNTTPRGGSYQVAVGSSALFYSTGRFNTAVGHQAGYGKNGKNNSGEYNTCVGIQSNCYSEDVNEPVSNSIALGANARATKSNQCVIGNSDVTEFVLGNKKLIFNNDNTVKWEIIS